jgi:hypothetical protein
VALDNGLSSPWNQGTSEKYSIESSSSDVLANKDLGDVYLQEALLKDLLADPPPLPSQSDLDAAKDHINLFHQTQSFVDAVSAKSGANSARKRDDTAKMPSREGPRKSDVGKAGSPSSKKAATSAASNEHLPAVSRTSSRAARSVHTGILEPNTSSAISDARFAVAHDIFSDSYATTESTIIGGPDARRSSDCTSDGESVTSPMAREEHNCVPPPLPVKPGKFASPVRKQGASHAGASSKESRTKAEKGPAFPEGSRLLRRRSSSGSTASEPSSKKTPSVAIKSEINGRTLGKEKERRVASSTSAHVGRNKPPTAVTLGVGDAASVASCPTGKPKWAGGSEELVTGLTRKLQLLESELSESRARESEAQRLLSIQNGEIAQLREKLNEAKGLEVTNQKREEELVEMAAFVRRLQERVKCLEAQNVALQLERGEAAKLEKGEGATDPEECAMPLDIKRGIGSVTQQLEPKKKEKKSAQDVEHLRGAVSQLTQQLHEMEAFLADYGLTWVGTAGPSYKPPSSSMHASGHVSGVTPLQVKPGMTASPLKEGQWEPSVSWVPEHPPGRVTEGGFEKPSSQTLSSQVAPTVNLSNPVPSWIAAHLQEPVAGALSPKPPGYDPPSPKPSKADALRSSLVSKSNLLSPGTMYNISSKNGQPEQKTVVDVVSLREAIGGLNALAGEGGSTVVTSPGGREHRLQVSGAQPTTEISQVNVC